MIIAATKTSEQHWLGELLGWAPETTEEYALNAFTKDITKRPDSEEYQLKDDQGSWELVKCQQVAVTTDLEVPEEYERFQNLFNQPEQPEVPEHSMHDHVIPLEEGKELTCKRIYPMSEKESQVLCDYITDQLQKGNIQLSKSLAGHRVLFIPKKDGGLQLCVDYRPLNNMTIKDRHPLPQIDKMQDCIRGVKYFTKLDITDTYY